MCGRFTQTRPWSELVSLYRITEAVSARPPERRYNIAPSHDVAVVRPAGEGHGRELVSLRWGLVPPWAKDLAMGARMINARAETVAEKPAFRAALRARRCLIIADGFYEWQAHTGQAKQPYHIAAADGRPLAFAGIWEHWRPIGAGQVETCAIITTVASPALRAIHDRMPAILASEDHDLWLNAEATADRVGKLLRPYPAALRARPVSRRINNIHNDDPNCVERAERDQLHGSGDLFA